jgi:ornithine cyclodeaminase/alanine dehydrogenase-like protein (mu-crystallin family)
MGNAEHAFIDEALIAPNEHADYTNAPNGPGMCFINRGAPLFKPVGTGLEDLAAARMVLDRARGLA